MILIIKNLKQIIKKFKPECIFNLAAETHVDRSIDNPDNFIKSNILGVYNLLEALKSYERFEEKNKINSYFDRRSLWGYTNWKKI